ncbi:MAG: hypothetical protein AB1635_21195 [Acidobacteriota bacterium]
MTLAGLLLAALLVQPGPGGLTEAQAAAFEQKLAAIVAAAAAPKGAARSRRATTVPQDELNAYLHYAGPDVLPAGVTNAFVTLHGQGRVAARAVVDLDEVRRTRSSGSLLDPRSYLTGRLPLTLTGLLTTAEGTARFAIERADVGGVPVPAAFVHEIVAYYSRSDEYPRGIDLVNGFRLPAEIERLEVATGRLVVVQ